MERKKRTLQRKIREGNCTGEGEEKNGVKKRKNAKKKDENWKMKDEKRKNI